MAAAGRSLSQGYARFVRYRFLILVLMLVLMGVAFVFDVFTGPADLSPGAVIAGLLVAGAIGYVIAMEQGAL